MGGKGSGRKPNGRPPKLTDAVTREVATLVQAGNYMETAAACVGVPPQTMREWLRKGRDQKRGLYSRFHSALKEAEARAEATSVARIRAHGEKSWQALAWYLERKHHTRWGRSAGHEPKEDCGQDDEPRHLVGFLVNSHQPVSRFGFGVTTQVVVGTTTGKAPNRRT